MTTDTYFFAILILLVILNACITALLLSRNEVKQQQNIYKIAQMHDEILAIVEGLSKIRSFSPEQFPEQREGKDKRQKNRNDGQRNPIGFKTEQPDNPDS